MKNVIFISPKSPKFCYPIICFHYALILFHFLYKNSIFLIVIIIPRLILRDLEIFLLNCNLFHWMISHSISFMRYSYHFSWKVFVYSHRLIRIAFINWQIPSLSTHVPQISVWKILSFFYECVWVITAWKPSLDNLSTSHDPLFPSFFTLFIARANKSVLFFLSHLFQFNSSSL